MFAIVVGVGAAVGRSGCAVGRWLGLVFLGGFMAVSVHTPLLALELWLGWVRLGRLVLSAMVVPIVVFSDEGKFGVPLMGWLVAMK